MMLYSYIFSYIKIYLYHVKKIKHAVSKNNSYYICFNVLKPKNVIKYYLENIYVLLLHVLSTYC